MRKQQDHATLSLVDRLMLHYFQGPVWTNHLSYPIHQCAGALGPLACSIVHCQFFLCGTAPCQFLPVLFAGALWSPIALCVSCVFAHVFGVTG